LSYNICRLFRTSYFFNLKMDFFSERQMCVGMGYLELKTVCQVVLDQCGVCFSLDSVMY